MSIERYRRKPKPDSDREDLAGALMATLRHLTPARICAHCGEACGDYDGGCAGITVGGEPRNVCHPNDTSRPDCYRRITVYHEPVGALIGVEVKPAGVGGL